MTKTLPLSDCRSCALRVPAEAPVEPDGDPPGAGLCVVMRRPDREDLLMGAANSPGGKFLRQAVAAAGWPAGRVYWTYAVKCAAAEGAKPKASGEQRWTCVSNWLLSELTRLPPDTPVVLAGVAQAHLLTDCAPALRGRPVYLWDAEGALMTGGRRLYDEAVGFFGRLRLSHGGGE